MEACPSGNAVSEAYAAKRAVRGARKNPAQPAITKVKNVLFTLSKRETCSKKKLMHAPRRPK